MASDMLSTSEVAEYLGIHEKQVYRLLRAGRLLEVATAVAEGRADVGVGIQAVARSLGLDFLPLTWERYDLLATDETFYRRPTQAFFEIVKSDWLRQPIAKLPGYDARETGLLSVIQPDTSAV